MTRPFPKPPTHTNDLGHQVQGTPEGVAEDANKTERKAQTAAPIKTMREKSAARQKSNDRGLD